LKTKNLRIICRRRTAGLWSDSTWAATGRFGKKPPREIVEVARLLEDLECSGITEEIDWDELVGGLPTLFRLGGDDFDDYPLILDFAEFEELSDLFLVIDLDEVKNLYVSKDEDERLQPLLAEFAVLARRLKAYPPLRDVMKYEDD
jgi:hypothetical protein